MEQGSIPPSLPFRLAAAYGAPAPAPLPERAPRQGAPRIVNDQDTVELSSLRAGAPTTGARRLVAGAVSVGVDFDVPAAQARAPGGTLAMYRHPADKNAAATAVNVGRSLDVSV